MGGKTKTTNTATAQNTYSHVAPPVTQEVTQAKNVAADLRGAVNPIIRQKYAGMRADYDNSFDNPLGQHTTPAIREASKRSKHESLHQAEMGDLQAAEFAANGTDFQRQMMIAQLTQPQLVQTGGTQNSTQTQSGGPGVLGSIIGGAANVGSAALM